MKGVGSRKGVDEVVKGGGWMRGGNWDLKRAGA